MRLTDWDEDTIEEYRQRWEKVRGLGGDAAFVGLAQLLSTHPKWPVDPKLLRHLTGSNNRARLYGTATLPKKRGGMRTLTIPVRKLRWVQRSVLQVITHLFPSHKCARGFVRGESIVSHAALHANKRWVYTVDIEDFFPSITWARLYGMFQSFPFNVSQDVARLLCNLTTYDDALPQGAPSSPILANLLCRKLDSRLYQWARKNGYTYSRYADDLTFSTNKRQFSEDDRAFIDRIIDEEQFKVNPSKRRLMSRGERQMVTGLVVNDKVSLPRSYVRGLRALLHNVERHGWKSQVYRSVLPLDDDTRDAYRARALEPGALKKVRQKQREGHHYLISPMASMPKAKDVKSFQRVVRGKIEFLGLVKGREDDSLYQDLLNHFTFLLAFEDQVDTSYAELRREVRKVDPAYAKRLGQYRRFDRAIRQLSEAELTDYLQGLADQTLEFGWLNNQAGNLDERKKEARRIAYAALMSPALTASFFRYFRRRESFSGILHAPTASDVDAQTMLANSEAIFRVYENFLPNQLQRLIRSFLDACKAHLRSTPNAHPWEDDEFRKQHLIPFKKGTRIDEDPNETTDLVDYLGSVADKVCEEVRQGEQKEVTVTRPDFNEVLFTDVGTVKRATELLLRSMITNTDGQHIVVSLDRRNGETDRRSEVVLTVRDDGGTISKGPDLSLLFGGKLRKVLSLLRGHAMWTLTASFKDGCSYQFDVMRNQPVKLEQAATGISHTISFYQIDG